MNELPKHSGEDVVALLAQVYSLILGWPVCDEGMSAPEQVTDKQALDCTIGSTIGESASLVEKDEGTEPCKA